MNLHFYLVNDTPHDLHFEETIPTGWSWINRPPQQVSGMEIFQCSVAIAGNQHTAGAIRFSGHNDLQFQINWQVQAGTSILTQVDTPSGYLSQHTIQNTGIPTISVTFLENSQWMEQMAAEIGGKQLREVVLPGTHDSGTAAITNTATFSPDEPKFVGKIEPLAKLFGINEELKTVVGHWAMSQSQTITAQLQAGIRYLDLRLWWNEDDQQIWIVHSMTSITMASLIDQVLDFAKDNPSEIVLLDFNHSYNFDGVSDSPSTTAFSNQISRLSAYLINRSTEIGPTATMDQLWSTGKSLIAFKAQTLPEVPSLGTQLWPDTDTWSHWTNTPNCPCKLHKLLQEDVIEQVSVKAANKVWVLQSILTPNAGVIVDGFTNDGPSTLLDLANTLNQSVQTWLTTDWKGANLNIIILDNAFSIPYMSIVKSLNKNG